MSNQAISSMFLLDTSSSNYITKASSWKEISDYLMFLTLSNGGCSKSSSGSLSILFEAHWTQSDGKVFAEIGGYDLQLGSRHTHFEAQSEDELKEQILEFLEKERVAQVCCKDTSDDDGLGF